MPLILSFSTQLDQSIWVAIRVEIQAGNGKDDYIVKKDLTKNIVVSKKVNTGRAEGPYYLTEYTIFKEAAFSTAVIHQVFESGCRQVP